MNLLPISNKTPEPSRISDDGSGTSASCVIADGPSPTFRYTEASGIGQSVGSTLPGCRKSRNSTMPPLNDVGNDEHQLSLKTQTLSLGAIEFRYAVTLKLSKNDVIFMNREYG